jgi:hypothetical protein
MFDGKLTTVPLEKDKLESALDVGTGTGRCPFENGVAMR